MDEQRLQTTKMNGRLQGDKKVVATCQFPVVCFNQHAEKMLYLCLERSKHINQLNF